MILHAVEAGDGPPLVLLHGLFGSARNFGAVQRHLAARFRVIALDLRNHGDSPHAATMTYDAMAEDVAETLARLGVGPAVVVGHSMGGKAAMRLALGRPGVVARLVVVDIAPAVSPPDLRGYVQAMMALDLAPGLTRAEADAALAAAVPSAAVRGFLLQNLKFGDAPAWRLGLAEIAAAMPAIEGWEAPEGARFDGPCLFVRGERSDYVRPEHRETIRALFPAVRFAMVKGAGHWVHAENPAGFLAVVESFAGS